LQVTRGCRSPTRLSPTKTGSSTCSSNKNILARNENRKRLPSLERKTQLHPKASHPRGDPASLFEAKTLSEA